MQALGGMTNTDFKNTSKAITYFLIDGGNNNKVINEFQSEEEAFLFVDSKKHIENWEDSYEVFQDFKDNFFTVTSIEMNEAIRTKGLRIKNYWT